MEMPSFDYSKMPSREGAGGDGTPEGGRVIESASASTAPQANSSNAAYVITGITLGIIAVLALAFTMLMYVVMGTAFSSSHVYEESYGMSHEDWGAGLDEELESHWQG